jgi:hypothetical protein
VEPPSVFERYEGSPFAIRCLPAACRSRYATGDRRLSSCFERVQLVVPAASSTGANSDEQDTQHKKYGR